MALEAPQFPVLDELRAKKTVQSSVLSLLGAEAQDTAPAVQALFRQVPYAAAPLLSDLLLESVDEIRADRIAQRLRELLPPETQQEAVAVQAAQIANQSQLAHALVQDGCTARALGAS